MLFNRLHLSCKLVFGLPDFNLLLFGIVDPWAARAGF